MRNKVPHNILTMSEMTKRPNKINSETIEAESLLLNEETVKKLRASSSMFNKSTYVKILLDGRRYNIESVERGKDGLIRIKLISNTGVAVLVGKQDEIARRESDRDL